MSQDDDENHEMFRAMQANMGLFGIIYSITLRVAPNQQSYFIMESVPSNTLFGIDDLKAAEQLRRLQASYYSLEFFYLPVQLKDLKVEVNKDVVCIKIKKRDPNEPVPKYLEGWDGKYEVASAEENEEFWKKRNTLMRFGDLVVSKVHQHAIFRLLLFIFVVEQAMNWIMSLDISIEAKFALYAPFVALSKVGFQDTKKAYLVSQKQANHYVNAVGAVEPIRVLDIEWCLPCSLKDATGMLPSSTAFAYIISEMMRWWTEKKQIPVSIAGEMRMFRPSRTLIAPEYVEAGIDDENLLWTAPECVSFSGNPAWNAFYAEMHEKMKQKFGNTKDFKTHLAKQGWALQGFLKWNREQYGERLETFKRQVQKVDPEGLFLNPFFKAWLFGPELEDSYMPPLGLPMKSAGQVELPPVPANVASGRAVAGGLAVGSASVDMPANVEGGAAVVSGSTAATVATVGAEPEMKKRKTRGRPRKK